MHVAVNVPHRVVNEGMDVVIVQHPVRAQRIGKHLRAGDHVLVNLREQYSRTLARNDHRPNAALLRIGCALRHAEHRRLSERGAPRFCPAEPVALNAPHLAADEGFVRLDRAGKHRAFPVLHGLADAMEHEPRRLLRHAERPRQLVGRGSVLRVRQEPQGRKPFGKRDRGLRENRVGFQRELPPAVLAAPRFAGRNEDDRSRSAALTRAGDPVGPAHGLHKLERAVRVREVGHSFQQRGGLGHAPSLYSERDDWVAL